MDYQKIVEWLPYPVRLRAYAVLGFLSLSLTALLAGWAASPYDVPWWINSALTGIGVLAGPFAIVAANHVTKPDLLLSAAIEDYAEPTSPQLDADGHGSDY